MAAAAAVAGLTTEGEVPACAICSTQIAESNDSIQLEALLGRAGRKAIATLAAALEDVFHRLREQHCGQWDLDPHGGYEYARRTMMAGRAGSWAGSPARERVMQVTPGAAWYH